MTPQTLSQFLADAADKPASTGPFDVESSSFLQVNLASSMVWIKVGSMVAYTGEIGFEREGAFDRGMGQFLKKTFTGEGAALSRATGTGALYLADRGKRVTVLALQGDSLFVNGNDLLAFQDGIQSEITMMRKMSAIASGGLFNVRLSGHGLVAITTHHRPLALPVKPGRPVVTDPQATVAWSGALTPEFKTDLQIKSFVGRGSGDSFQMKFEGDGFVVIQPYEEQAMQTGK